MHCLYKSTGGPGWACNEGWDRILEANLASLYGVSTTAAGRVTKVSLGANNLEGSFPYNIHKPAPVASRSGGLADERENSQECSAARSKCSWP